MYKQGSLDLWVLHCHKCQLLVNTKIPAHLGDSWKSPQWHSLAREAPENSYRKTHFEPHKRNIWIVLLLTSRCFHCPVEMHHRESKPSPANFHLHLTSPEYKHSNANSLLNRYFSVLSDLCESKRHVLCCNPEHLLWIFPKVEVAVPKMRNVSKQQAFTKISKQIPQIEARQLAALHKECLWNCKTIHGSVVSLQCHKLVPDWCWWPDVGHPSYTYIWPSWAMSQFVDFDVISSTKNNIKVWH